LASLTTTAIDRAKILPQRYKLADGGGLYVAVFPSGKKVFRYEYRLHGKRETLTLGTFPGLSLAEARERHAKARRLVGDGESPALRKRRDKAAGEARVASTFKNLAEDWYKAHSTNRSFVWRNQARRWLDQRILPKIGGTPIADVTREEVLGICKAAHAEGRAHTADRVRQVMSAVFDYAIGHELCERNPARAIAGVLPQPPRKQQPALKPGEIPALIAKVESYGGRPSTKAAFRLLLLTFVRKGELVRARWDEVDFDAALWRIPAERVKTRTAHVVPLSRQAVAAFRELQSLAASSEFVLPHLSTLARPMSENTFNRALVKMGYGGKFAPHGFRRTASTILNEEGYRPDVIERQLAHKERDAVRAAYNQADYLAERRQMMQWWADHIDDLVAGRSSKVTGISKGTAKRATT
jgi:integrase